MNTGHLVLVGALYVGSAILVSLAGLYTVRRLVPHHVLAPHNDVAGFVYATIAVTYAVILGFVVVTVWEQHETALRNVEGEANSIADLYRLAEWFPEAEKHEIQQSLLDYVQSVIDDEWSAMNRGAAPSPQTIAQLDRIWGLYRQADEGSAGQLSAYDDSLERLQDLGNARQMRLLESREGIPGILWFELMAGALLTVGFAYNFGVERSQSHTLMVTILAASVALLLFLVTSLDFAFQGDVRIEPEPFQLILEQFSLE